MNLGDNCDRVAQTRPPSEAADPLSSASTSGKRRGLARSGTGANAEARAVLVAEASGVRCRVCRSPVFDSRLRHWNVKTSPWEDEGILDSGGGDPMRRDAIGGAVRRAELVAPFRRPGAGTRQNPPMILSHLRQTEVAANASGSRKSAFPLARQWWPARKPGLMSTIK